MPCSVPLAPLLLLAGLTSNASVPSAAVAGERPNAVERYGLGGFIQPIGLHHGFHIEKVVPDSPAERDRLAPHEIIVKVAGEEVRGLEHLRSLLTDIDEDDGEAELTIMKNRPSRTSRRQMPPQGPQEIRPAGRRPLEPPRRRIVRSPRHPPGVNVAYPVYGKRRRSLRSKCSPLLALDGIGQHVGRPEGTT